MKKEKYKLAQQNFETMLQILSCEKNISKLNGPNNRNSFVARIGRTASLPCYNTLRKLQNWREGTGNTRFGVQQVSKGTIQSIVNFFNEVLTPSVSFNDFINIPLAQVNYKLKPNIAAAFNRAEFQNADRFLGSYYIYYLSDNEEAVHRGYLSIYQADGILRAYMFMGFIDEKHFKGFLDSGLLQIDLCNEENFNSSFVTYRAALPEHYIHCSLCTGTVEVTSSLLLTLSNPNNNLGEYYMYCCIPLDSDDVATSFSGGLGIYFSPATTHLSARVCKFIMTRKNFDTTSDIFDGGMLRLQPTQYGRIELTAAEARQWKYGKDLG